MKVGIVTGGSYPDLDEGILLEALTACGVQAVSVHWDQPHDPAEFDLMVVRSTWNYHLHYEAFKSWMEHAAQTTKLLNPATTMLWNTHKSYLKDLAAKGIPTIPSEFFSKGDEPDWQPSGDSDEVVIKPCVSGGSYLTRRFRADEPAAADWLKENLQQRDMMVQPLIESILTEGERNLVWIDGELTHGLIKAVRFEGDEFIETPHELADQDREFANRVLNGMDGLLYARVDVMREKDGSLVLSELELVEPFLFLGKSEAALERLVSGILARL